MRQERGYWSLERGWGWVFSEDYCGFSCKVFRLPDSPSVSNVSGTVMKGKSLFLLYKSYRNYITYSAYGTCLG
jgi:hypothetical protein